MGENMDRIIISGNDFVLSDRKIWLNGVNTPWNIWNEFGGDFDENFWSDHFCKLKNAGVNSVRVWINCSRMVGVKLNKDGSFDRVTEKHWKDLSILLDLAEQNGLYIMATLLSFDHFKDENAYYDRWRFMITDRAKTEEFVNGYVVSLAKKFADKKSLFSIDLINEPDWVFENDECSKIQWEYLSTYFALASAAIHKTAPEILVTVGIASVKYNSEDYYKNVVSDAYLQSLVQDKDAYLDFYSPHYYPWMRKLFGLPYNTAVDKYIGSNDKPCVLGEVPAHDEQEDTLKSRYENSYKNGWKGVYAWTSNRVDGCGGYEDIVPATQHMCELLK